MVSLIKRTTVNVARAATTAAPMATLALLVAFGATRAVASIVVDPNTTPCVSATTHYTTIQAAVSAAASGATIQVCPANYAEQVTIATPLTLKGVTNTTGNTGAAVVTIPNNTFSGAYTQIVINATGVTLTDIGVDGTNSLSSCSSATLTGSCWTRDRREPSRMSCSGITISATEAAATVGLAPPFTRMAQPV